MSAEKLITSKLLRVVTFCISFFYISINSFPASSKDIVFFNPASEINLFWKNVSLTMESAAHQLGLELEIIYCDKSLRKMKKYATHLLARAHPPKYIVAVNENSQGKEIVELIKGTNINLLFILNDLTEEEKLLSGRPRTQTPNWLGSITPDAEAGGYEMAKAIINASNQKYGTTKHLFALGGDDTTPSSIARNNGLLRALKPYKKSINLHFESVNWSQKTAYKVTRRFLKHSSNLGVKAFWGGNDDISIGIMHALDATGQSGGGDYFIAGLNWSAPALKLVKNGKMLLTHGGHFFAGAWSMVVIYDHKKGIDFITESVDLMFPMSAITRQNVDRYANTFKLPKDWKKINYKRFTKTHNTDIKKYDFSLKNIFLHTQYP